MSRICPNPVRISSCTTERWRPVVTAVRSSPLWWYSSEPLITAAGAILALSFAAYTTGSVMYLQMLGAGMAVAVLVDATVVRAVLVPALMRLAGRANWWAPPFLRRVHTRFGLAEGSLG
ncbi:MMPL family transporter [Saccharothrix sp.]|uniref:MMPL family transporter n=1 Tax=Saccharothrix sp. TaxID=1873460 RepID=UPI002811F647|nr:MMPL family transporter [Saccharothrix sp.]